jgi:hypothetical protein
MSSTFSIRMDLENKPNRVVIGKALSGAYNIYAVLNKWSS